MCEVLAFQALTKMHAQMRDEVQEILGVNHDYDVEGVTNIFCGIAQEYVYELNAALLGSHKELHELLDKAQYHVSLANQTEFRRIIAAALAKSKEITDGK